MNTRTPGGNETKPINPVKQAQLIRALAKHYIRREGTETIMILGSNLAAMDNFDVEVSLIEDPRFQAEQYLFHVKAKR